MIIETLDTQVSLYEKGYVKMVRVFCVLGDDTLSIETTNTCN